MINHGIHKGAVLFIAFVMYFNGAPAVFADDSQVSSFERQVLSSQNAGDTKGATVIARKFVDYAERRFGQTHKHTVAAWHVLGQAYFSDGRYREAEGAYIKALTVEERIVGPNHKDLVPHLEALITVYYSLVRFDQAAKMKQRVDKIRD
ncbi:MAG: tetratricopeptide repeat protein [Methyloligellaceae bacterium]